MNPQSLPTWIAGLPNQLTVVRVLFVPFILLLYPWDFKYLTIICGLLYSLAALTDVFDGMLARHYGLESRLGATLDPIADKILSATGILLLCGMDRLPIFLGGLLLLRDIAINGIRLIAAKENVDIEVSGFGKLKTIFQSTALSLLLIHYPLLGLPLQTIGMVLIWLSLLLSYYSGFLYVKEFWLHFHEKAPVPLAIKDNYYE
ncbi:MAG: CDP-diacylglycerol--glycerol-3-phosphate 3-phosphatidyltransferase [Oligoflexales bacterium]|nr:CDP-diacylglycerol--glycerol-3-phosphate 3-phosphatidyltransferase [Oligoflexales bacterium]